jgi:hypothetical protein
MKKVYENPYYRFAYSFLTLMSDHGNYRYDNFR